MTLPQRRVRPFRRCDDAADRVPDSATLFEKTRNERVGTVETVKRSTGLGRPVPVGGR
jgi:hypothetical protein